MKLTEEDLRLTLEVGEYVGIAIGQARLHARVRESEARLAHQVLHDPLTGLANRRLFDDRLSHALERASREDKKVAVLYLDLNGFKEINDRYGHEAGDELLVQTSRRLASCLRTSDTAARLGGDEFALLLEDVKDEGDARRTAGRLFEKLTSPFTIDGYETAITASIGISLNDGEGVGESRQGSGELIRKADLAMYHAKRNGKNRLATFGTATSGWDRTRPDVSSE
jgi:diguanylate cyclase (GGDEF)-like protein